MSKIEDYILDERYDHLNKSINLYIKKLKQKGLAKQLQYYRAFSSFDASQFIDLFDDIINDQREKYIFKINQEIEHVMFLISQSKMKLERKERKCFKSTKDVREKHLHVKSIYDTFNQRLGSLKRDQETSEQMYVDKIKLLQECVYNANRLYIYEKSILSHARKKIIDARDELSAEVSGYYDIINLYHQRVKTQLHKRIEHVVAKKVKSNYEEMYALQNELENLRLESQELSFALQNVFEYIKLISGIEADTSQNLVEQIPTFIRELYNGVVSKYLSDSRCLVPGILLTKDKFIPSIKTALQKAIDKRQKQFDAIQTYERKKRLTLQSELDKIYKKYDQDSILSQEESELFDNMYASNYEIQESTRHLDETMKILSSSPLLSKINKSHS